MSPTVDPTEPHHSPHRPREGDSGRYSDRYSGMDAHPSSQKWGAFGKADNFTDKVVLSKDQLDKLQERNQLLDVLENQGQQIVVVGDTSSGKSTTINFLLGYPFNFVAQGVGTRRPCVMTLTPDSSCDVVLFKVKFQKHEYIEERELTSLAEVAALVKGVNDPRAHPEWFDCLNIAYENGNRAPVRVEDAFDDTPIYVQMLHKDIDCPMRLVDVPGLTRGNCLPTQIALSYIKPDNVVILVIGKDHPNNGGFPHLAAAMRQCSRTIVIQNFANTKIADNQVMENYQVLHEKMGVNGRSDLALYCIDYGIPYEPGLPLWQEGYDQQDWHKINNTKGIDAVRTAMLEHTRMRATQLYERFKNSRVFSEKIIPGLDPVRSNLNDFQFHDIEGHIRSLRKQLREQIAKYQTDLQKAALRVKQLQFPPEWDNMLAAFASSIRKYLDATVSATENVEPFRTGEVGGDKDSCILWSTDEETKRVTKSGLDKADATNSPGVFWFNEDVDKRIVALMSEYCGFEANLRLACLRSWQRLADEFTGMLAFAPMPCVPASAHDMAKMRVGSGHSGQLNFTEETVQLVVGLEKRRGLVRPILQHFERRMRLLVERDFRNGVSALHFHCKIEMERFYNLIVQEETEETERVKFEEVKAKVLAGVLKALLSHADRVITRVMQGEPELDKSGEPIVDSITNRTLLKDRSGIMVRVQENSTSPGPLHWMLPFKFNNSGQTALRILKYGRGAEPWRHFTVDRSARGLPRAARRMGWCCDRQSADDEDLRPEKPWSDRLVEEISLPTEDGAPTINCCNAVNLRIFRLCTEDYEVPMSPNSPSWLYDMEVLKLLKSLQFELAAAWASMWRGMLQELTDRDKVRTWIRGELMKLRPVMDLTETRASGFERMESWGENSSAALALEHDPTLNAADAVVNWLSGSQALPTDMLTTEEEIKKAGEEAKWPDHMGYLDVLSKLAPDKVKTAFLANKDTRLAGQPSWLRLCDEFVFVILQLQMRRVSPEELSMAKASAGMMSAAGQQEIIAKLTLHRMSQLNLHSQQVFRRRFDFLYKRDIKAGLSNLEGIAHGLKGMTKNGEPALEWLEGHILQYKDMVISRNLAALTEKFDGMQPFDFAILNGRFPMNSRKMRKLHFHLLDDGKTLKKENALSDIKEMWTSQRYATNQEVEATPPDGKNPGVMQLSVRGTHEAYENLQEQRERVEQIFNLPCSDPPAADYAGGVFQELCLKFFKGIHVDAIHHCRPRLKAMMARLYQEEDLRRALQESEALDYLKDFGGHILERQRLKVETLRMKVAEMEKLLSGENSSEATSEF